MKKLPVQRAWDTQAQSYRETAAAGAALGAGTPCSVAPSGSSREDAFLASVSFWELPAVLAVPGSVAASPHSLPRYPRASLPVFFTWPSSCKDTSHRV